MYIPVSRLIPGDLIVTDTDDILVTELHCPDFIPGVAGVFARIDGRITRGVDRSATIRSWTYPSDHVVDVERPQPAPGSVEYRAWNRTREGS